MTQPTAPRQRYARCVRRRGHSTRRKQGTRRSPRRRGDEPRSTYRRTCASPAPRPRAVTQTQRTQTARHAPGDELAPRWCGGRAQVRSTRTCEDVDARRPRRAGRTDRAIGPKHGRNTIAEGRATRQGRGDEERGRATDPPHRGSRPTRRREPPSQRGTQGPRSRRPATGAQPRRDEHDRTAGHARSARGRRHGSAQGEGESFAEGQAARPTVSAARGARGRHSAKRQRGRTAPQALAADSEQRHRPSR